MHETIAVQWPIIEAVQTLRREILAAVSDADLNFSPGGQALTLGALCREMGEVDAAYVQSFQAFRHQWLTDTAEPGIETSTERLNAGFDRSFSELETTLSAYTVADLQKPIDRNGSPIPFEMQFGAYLQAWLIFAGKASIYLRVLSKPLPEKLADWVW